MSNRNEGQNTKRSFKIELHFLKRNYWQCLLNERDEREVLSQMPSLWGKNGNALGEEALRFWRKTKVQGKKQGSVRRIKEAAEAELDPKRMLRTHRRLFSNKPSLDCEGWEGISAPAQSCQSHVRALPLPLTCMSYNSRACAAQWGGRASAV